jgi:uncharacterized membrane protein YbhN (UPF0104 family)
MSRRRNLLRLGIALVVVAGLVFATRKAVDQWNEQTGIAQAQVRELDRQIDRAQDPTRKKQLRRERDTALAQVPSWRNLDLSALTTAGLLYAIGLIPGGMVLGEATKSLGHSVSLRGTLSAQIIGHLGKYVPGKAMVVVLRAGRLAELNVPLKVGTVAVFLETILMMAVGAALSGCIVAFLPVPVWIAAGALIGGIGAAIPTTPPILRLVLLKIGVGRKQENDAAPRIGARIGHSWRFFCLAWIWQSVGWFLIGGSFAAVVLAIPGSPPEQADHVVILASIAAMALAMVVGFASLLPGGAGIRELTLAIVLAPIVGNSRALLAAILARLLFIAIEFLAAGLVAAVSGSTSTASTAQSN